MKETKKAEESLKKALEIIEDVCFQYAEVKDRGRYYRLYSGGLSTLEECFMFLVEHGRAKGNHLVIKIPKSPNSPPETVSLP